MKKKLLFVFLSILLLFTAAAVRFARGYASASEDYAQTGIQGELTYRIDSAVAASLDEYCREYSELTDITYLPDGRIGAIEVNAAKLNTIALETAKTVYASIADSENDFGIPLGNAFGSRLLSGKGPKIGVRIIPISAVSYKIENQLISGGINQTLHRISIRYTATVKCLAPFDDNLIYIDSEAIVAETLIVGEVPKVLLSNPASLGELSGTFE